MELQPKCFSNETPPLCSLKTPHKRTSSQTCVSLQLPTKKNQALLPHQTYNTVQVEEISQLLQSLILHIPSRSDIPHNNIAHSPDIVYYRGLFISSKEKDKRNDCLPKHHPTVPTAPKIHSFAPSTLVLANLEKASQT